MKIYQKFFKRIFDFFLVLIAIIILFPVYMVLIVLGLINMRGNPFFVQKRVGKNEKIFNLIKFRSMSNKKDKEGNLLPDVERLNKYGRFIRSSSLDELPELFNILIGNMSIVGPRPLLTSYLNYYNDFEKHRHDVLPGLTGLAQVNGRNRLNWDERFKLDVEYVNNITFFGDIKIIFKTILNVICRKDVVVRGTSEVIDFDEYRKKQNEEKIERK